MRLAYTLRLPGRMVRMQIAPRHLWTLKVRCAVRSISRIGPHRLRLRGQVTQMCLMWEAYRHPLHLPPSGCSPPSRACSSDVFSVMLEQRWISMLNSMEHRRGMSAAYPSSLTKDHQRPWILPLAGVVMKRSLGPRSSRFQMSQRWTSCSISLNRSVDAKRRYSRIRKGPLHNI